MSRQKSLKRTGNKRSPKARFIVFCEGKNTEPQYIQALERELQGTIIEVEVIGGAGTPATIAGKAIDNLRLVARKKKKQSFEKNDQVWAVFDHDEHPEVTQSIQRCRDAGVGIAYSNPCFELWLILHKEAYDKACDRHQVQKHLETLCPEYDCDSGKSADCSNLIENLEQAEDRANVQLARRAEEGSVLGCPCTTVQEFTQALRAAHASYKAE